VLASAVRFSWYHNYERSIITDEDREKIDLMVGNLYTQAFNGTFPNSNQGLRAAHREFWILGQEIEKAIVK
jgi:hypothetical protein